MAKIYSNLLLYDLTKYQLHIIIICAIMYYTHGCIFATITNMNKYLLLLVPIIANAGSDSNCYAIQDPDLRAQCLAVARQNSSSCYSIQNSNKRSYCLGVSEHNRSRCYAITDSDQRQYCLAQSDLR
jgi:hypothetical protein